MEWRTAKAARLRRIQIALMERSISRLTDKSTEAEKLSLAASPGLVTIALRAGYLKEETCAS
jgi:phage terminase large subunit-like protein